MHGAAHLHGQDLQQQPGVLLPHAGARPASEGQEVERVVARRRLPAGFPLRPALRPEGVRVLEELGEGLCLADAVDDGPALWYLVALGHTTRR